MTEPTGHPVTELYQGEVLGEALFNRMLADVSEPDQLLVVAAMLQLETETKARLRPEVVRRGLPVREEDAMRTDGEAVAASLTELSWAAKMTRLATGIGEQYLPRYRELADAAAPEDEDVTAFMVAHEEALLDAARRAADGDAAGALAALAPQLHHPLR